MFEKCRQEKTTHVHTPQRNTGMLLIGGSGRSCNETGGRSGCSKLRVGAASTEGVEEAETSGVALLGEEHRERGGAGSEEEGDRALGKAAVGAEAVLMFFWLE